MIIFILLFIWIVITMICGSLIFKYKYHIKKEVGNDVTASVSIIIPARNEADNLPILLKSIQQQKSVDTEVIVANDDSTDGTAEIARDYNARIIDVPKTDSPGKYFACYTGSQHAQEDLFLFMDADTFFINEYSLKDLCSQYIKHDSKGILSVQPFHQTREKHETLSAIFNLMTVTGINIFSAFKNKYHAGTVFGPLLLTNRSDYEKTGGHMAAKGHIIEGSGIYDSYVSQNLPVFHYLGKNYIHFRMYSDGFRSMTDGWKKHISIGARHTSKAIMGLIMTWLSSSIVFPVLLIYTLLYDINLILFPVLLYLICCMQFYNLCRPVIDITKIESIFHPLHQYFFFFVYTLSLYQINIKKAVKWKDREIKYEK